MNKLLSQYNLTPGERRIIAIIFLVFIVVLNFVFVWPHFGEWGSMKRQLAKMRADAANEQKLIDQDRSTNGLRDQINALETKEIADGANITADRVADPKTQLQTTVLTEERKTGVIVSSQTPGAVRTNDAFFEEHSVSLTMECEEEQLINFLYSMGNNPAMIRVSRLDLKPLDANRYKLRSALVLTASYARQTPVAAPTNSGGLKPGGPKPQPMAKNQPATNRNATAASLKPRPPTQAPGSRASAPAANQPNRRPPNTPPNATPPGFIPNKPGMPQKRNPANPGQNPTAPD